MPFDYYFFQANALHLAAELESIITSHVQDNATLSRKHSHEVDNWRKTVGELRDQNQQLEKEIQVQSQLLRDQQQHLQATKAKPPPRVSLNASCTSEYLEQIQQLSDQVHDQQEQLQLLTLANGDLGEQLGNAQEKIQCLQETLTTKREELEERDQTIDQYQDTIQELRAELMELQSKSQESATDCNKKGNSLFAEVVDQRQQVVQLLGAQNQSFKQMKFAYHQREGEVRRLKEENALMVNEIGKIKSIFLSADKSHINQLHKRIGDLSQDLEKSRKREMFFQEQVRDGRMEAMMDSYM